MPEQTEWELVDETHPGAQRSARPQRRVFAGGWGKWKLALLLAFSFASLILVATAAGVLVLATTLIAMLTVAAHKLMSGLRRACRARSCHFRVGPGQR